MKNRKVLLLIICLIITTIIIFLIKSNYKNAKFGNNIVNKSADEIQEYILNIESYSATCTIDVKSNKNSNTYKVQQKYNKQDNIYKQEILEPENIKGVQFIYDGKNLKIENTKLNLNKIYKDYNYINSNDLSLISFIEDYKQSANSTIKEENNIIILETECVFANQYTEHKKLYINKEQNKIEKMEIQDMTQNTKIYILYNEIEINTIQKDEIIAFSIYAYDKDI